MPQMMVRLALPGKRSSKAISLAASQAYGYTTLPAIGAASLRVKSIIGLSLAALLTLSDDLPHANHTMEARDGSDFIPRRPVLWFNSEFPLIAFASVYETFF